MPTENPGEIKGNTRLVRSLTGLICIMFPVGLVIMFTDFGKPYLWTTTIFLALQALTLILVQARLADTRSAIISAVLLFALSFGIEYTGVTTSIPFGRYIYASPLVPLIAGVPVAISFAWYSVTLSSFLVVKFFLPGVNSFITAFIAAILILATDILLEPFASFINVFWIWDNGTIPMINFISWFVIGFVFSLAVDKLSNWNNGSTAKALLAAPLIIFAINILNFTVLNVVYGYYVFIVTGLTLLIAEFVFIKNFRTNEA